jgi:cytochrome c oxidase cbb3-type subunit III
MTIGNSISSFSRRLRFISAMLILLAATVSFHPTRAQEAKASSKKNQTAATSAAEGRKVFESICAACHGLDGRGGERGPNIVTRAEVLHRSDGELLHLLQTGLPESGMPPFESLGLAKLKSVVAHLRFLQGASEVAPLPGNPQDGKSLFFGRAGCGNCHMVNGSGGFLGADLSSYGSNVSIEEIRSAITDPNKDLEPRARTVLAMTREGQQFTGVARNEDNFSLQLQSVDGTFHLFAKSDLEHLEYQPRSLMPSDYSSTLSRTELDDLVSYLISAARATKHLQAPRTKSKRAEEDD